MMQTVIHKAIEQQDLTREEAFNTMETIMSGEATPAQIGAFLVALRIKGETPSEIAGFAESMRSKASKVTTTRSEALIDIVGTGGDGKHTINVSTLSAFVAAGAGVPVAKHGNRSVSSKCGAADVLMALGVNIDLTPDQMSRCLDEVGIAFLFAPKLHGAMKYAIGPRREIGVRTVFNILGPITNPAGVKRQLIGVYDRALTRLLAEVLQQLDAEHIWLVHSDDGMDEISPAAKTHVAELKNGEITEFDIEPADFGLSSSSASIVGGDAAENAGIARDILQGLKGVGRDVILANSAASLYLAGKAGDVREGAKIAAESLDSGAAWEKLHALSDFTHSFS
ncbi:MAG: anthranilate phosphoribosyltransferase [bacterium]|nr:anthranilate phosphoribosyltransferase [bacterium]